MLKNELKIAKKESVEEVNKNGSDDNSDDMFDRSEEDCGDLSPQKDRCGPDMTKIGKNYQVATANAFSTGYDINAKNRDR